MSQPALRQDSTADKLLSAVLELAAEYGPAELSSRSLADRAGVSPSAVNYTFGSLDDLFAEAGVQADARRAQAWTAKAADLESLPCEPTDFGSMLFAATRDIAVRLRGEESLFWNDVIDAARIARPVYAAGGLASERTYWTHLLQACCLDTVKADVPHAFSLALRFAYQVFDAPDAFDAWAMALATRFAARLTGAPCETPDDSAYRRRAEDLANLSESLPVPEHETARLILRAAIETILEDGTEAATFREIARRAGLSVSSVQHFFGSRRAYLIAAFQAVYSSARDRAIKDVPVTKSLAASELAQHLAGSDREVPKLSPQEFAAMQGLILSASRDAETRTLAEGLVARTGQTSETLLKALKSPRGQIGRLDAQIVSLTLTQFVTLDICGAASGEGDGEVMVSLAEHLLVKLFQ